MVDILTDLGRNGRAFKAIEIQKDGSLSKEAIR